MGTAFGDPKRVVGMHFFNPAEKMRLVEVVRGPLTDGAVIERARGWVAALGKTAVVCEDSPNFIVNRICRPLYYEAQLLATQGVAPATVDAVARGGLAHRMGPLEPRWVWRPAKSSSSSGPIRWASPPRATASTVAGATPCVASSWAS